MLFAVTVLLAAAPQVRLSYSVGGTACPGREALVSAVRARLGADPFVEQSSELIDVDISTTGRSLVARLVRKSGAEETGRRELASPTADCSELFKALELAVAMAIDPRAGLVLPRPPEPVVAPAPAAPATPLLLHAGVAPLATVGTGPSPTGGVALVLGLQRGYLLVNLGGRVELPVSLTVETGRVWTQALVGEVAGCLAVSVFRACARASLGALRVGTEGLMRETIETLVLATVGARLAVEWQPTRLLIVRPYLDLDAHLARTTLLADGRVLWNMPPLLGVLGLAVLLTTGG